MTTLVYRPSLSEIAQIMPNVVVEKEKKKQKPKKEELKGPFTNMDSPPEDDMDRAARSFRFYF